MMGGRMHFLGSTSTASMIRISSRCRFLGQIMDNASNKSSCISRFVTPPSTASVTSSVILPRSSSFIPHRMVSMSTSRQNLLTKSINTQFQPLGGVFSTLRTTTTTTTTTLPVSLATRLLLGTKQQQQQHRTVITSILRSHQAHKEIVKSSPTYYKNHFRHQRIRFLVKLIKYIRIPALILSVYGLGYQKGIIDYSCDPNTKREELLDVILSGVGCTDRSKAHILRDGELRLAAGKGRILGESKMEERVRNVATVGSRVVKTAKKFVEEQLRLVLTDRMSKLSSDVTLDERKVYDALQSDEEVVLWTEASRRMAGEWSYVLVETHVPNAFVSEILPQRIFVTTAMIDAFISNDDEMGLVLGHEVSHLILGHVSEANSLEMVLRTVEVLLLTLDPTEGLLSLAVISFLAAIRRVLGAAQSRDNERQADEMGIKLAAMACYDTKRAAEVFYKMHQLGTESGATTAEKKTGRSLLSFVDTHPPSGERYEYLMRASEVERLEKYQDSTCADVRSMIRDILKTTKKKVGREEKLA